MAILDDLIGRAHAQQANAPKSGLQRVVGLDSQFFSDEEKEDLVERWWRALRNHPQARKPRPIQAEILEVAHRQAQKPAPEGMLGLVGVGAGKTLAFFLLPQVYKAERPLLLLPADMISGGQMEADHHEWSQEYGLLPLHIVKGGRVPVLDRRTLFVMSYAQLSQPSGTDVLRRMGPDLVLSDECHYLRAADAARTKRFLRYFQDSPGTRFVGMSGTMTGTSIMDYHHLAALALRDGSFLPEDATETKRWCAVLDAGKAPRDLDRIALDPLVTWARKQTGKESTSVLAGEKEVRQAYNYRMVTTPGVVATTSPSCDARLLLTAKRDIDFVGEDETELTVPQAMKTLMEEDTLPNGLAVTDALSKARAAQQLSMGFYYYWVWPDGVVDEDYVTAKRGYDGAIRQYLKGYSREGCDSPMLVDQYIRQARAENRRISEDLVYWQTLWDEQKKKPEPPTEAAWLDFSVVLAAVEWSRENEGFVWFRSRAVGQALAAFDIPTFWEGMPNPRDHRRAALSLNVFNKGKNLQAWQNQLFMEIPADAKMWEQSLGRTHRAGQEAPLVEATILQHTWVMRRSWRTALQRARYIQSTTGQLQRLCFAERRGLTEPTSFDPKPF